MVANGSEGSRPSAQVPNLSLATDASQAIPMDQPLLGFDAVMPQQPPHGEQGVLFTDPVSLVDENLGYRGPTACKAAGITYRQLDYWARTKLVTPTVRSASGSGSQRLYSFRDVLVLKIVKRLLDTGVSLQQIRTSVEHLRTRGVEDLSGITLMSDGASVYECTSPTEVIDLVQAGQGVFGIAIGRVWRELEVNLSQLPGEVTQESQDVAGEVHDELSALRARKAAR
ncbi:transcriptional regulator [Rothia aerolata]|uniref:Transcriptional regulator n=2 Tax=Rothia aerolata TaxID=1812262 RepID=A0A917MPM2_9MICC|nr:transcriptional regulator [Rothia aerolata]